VRRLVAALLGSKLTCGQSGDESPHSKENSENRLMKIACIDVGSNSIKLVVVDAAASRFVRCARA
jgi:hypothetical protein